jgi:hypothetical protein
MLGFAAAGAAALTRQGAAESESQLSATRFRLQGWQK